MKPANTWREAIKKQKLTFTQKRAIRAWKVCKGICWICNGYIPHPILQTSKLTGPNALTLDHIIPVVKGGSNKFENIKAAHSYCNSIRGCNEGSLSKLELTKIKTKLNLIKLNTYKDSLLAFMKLM